MSVVLLSLKSWITLGRGVQRQLAIHTWNFDKGLRWEHIQTEEAIWVVAAVKLLRESQDPLGTNLTALPSSVLVVQVEPLPHPCSLHLHMEPAQLCLPRDLFLYVSDKDRQKQRAEDTSCHGWLRTRYWTQLAAVPRLEMGIMVVSASECLGEYSSF